MDNQKTYANRNFLDNNNREVKVVVIKNRYRIPLNPDYSSVQNKDNNNA
jgi:hypothetical protein